MVTTAKAAEILGVEQRTVQKWVEKGLIDTVRVTTRLNLIPTAEVERMKSRNTRPGRPKQGD